MSFFESGPRSQTKICGITNPADAEVCIAAGADALGFNFYAGSSRHIALEKSLPWISKLKGKVQRIAVVVNPTAEEVAALLASGGFEAIQFHGDETPDFCAQSGFEKWIRAARIKDQTAFEEALAYDTPYLLLDAFSPEAYGGTGHRLNWDAAREFVIANPDRKVILAGGLTPHNVRDAVRIVRPHAVDVASGVEMEARYKDEYLVREFIAVAKNV